MTLTRTAPRTTEAPVADRRRRRRLAAGVAVVVVLIVLAVLDLSAGERWIAPSEVLASLTGNGSAGTDFLVRELRGPRVVAALLVGAGLGLSGGITQSLLRNPLASPDIIGVTAGASCLATISLLAASAGLGVAAVTSAWSLAVVACAGGMVAGIGVVALAWRGGIEARRVILVGLGVNAGLGALTSWLLVRADLPELTAAMIWLTGSLNEIDPDALGPALAGTAACLLVTVATGRWLGLLRFGAYTVRSLGVNLPLAQLVQAVVAITAASLACAVAGPVAFVAFAAPQLALVIFKTEGPPPLAGALVGAVIMVGADLIARVAFPLPLPVGLVTAAGGAPLLLWLLLRHRS